MGCVVWKVEVDFGVILFFEVVLVGLGRNVCDFWLLVVDGVLIVFKFYVFCVEERNEFFDVEVGEDFVVLVECGCFCLFGFFFYFCEGGGVVGDVDLMKIDVVFIEKCYCFVVIGVVCFDVENREFVGFYVWMCGWRWCVVIESVGMYVCGDVLVDLFLECWWLLIVEVVSSLEFVLCVGLCNFWFNNVWFVCYWMVVVFCMVRKGC